MSNQFKPANPNEALAAWLAQNQPDVFKALVARAASQGKLHGITDWISNVGTSFGTAVKAVGSFVSSPAGMGALTSMACVYLQSQAQKDALKLQISMAQACYAPAPVTTNPTSGQYPMYVDPRTGQQIPLTSQLANSLMPQKSLSDYAPWLIGGGLLLLGFSVYARK